MKISRFKAFIWATFLSLTLFICHASFRLLEISRYPHGIIDCYQQENFPLLVKWAAYVYTPRSYESCRAKLNQIDGAIYQLGLEKKLNKTNKITFPDLADYLKGGQQPHCPEGGRYLLGTVGEVPRCTVKGHSL